MGPGLADRLSAEKIEAIGIEYSYLLTSQLDSQREYYEEQKSELQSEVGHLKQAVEQLSRDVERARVETLAESTRKQQEADERTQILLRDKTRAEKKAEKVFELSRRLEKELREERAVSEGLMVNFGKMKERVESAEAGKELLAGKIADLEDQLRDVMFFLEAKTKIENEGGVENELAGGSIELASPLPSATKKKKNTKKG